LQSEAAVEALRRKNEGKRLLQNNSTEVKSALSLELIEEEKRAMTLKINELKMTCEEKEAQRIADSNDRKKLEKDIKHLKHTLEKRNTEINTSANYSSVLRSEGRNARKLIFSAVEQIKEIINVVRIDALSTGAEFGNVSKSVKGTQNSDFNYDETSHLGLAEALGIHELTSAVDSMKVSINWVKSLSRSRIEMDAQIKRLNEENSKLQKDVKDSEQRKNEILNQYKEEVILLFFFVVY
jgi:septal ring factor EnvC (AmiA/AmiB activator)